MNEADWLAGKDVEAMLHHVAGGSVRKLRLLPCAWAGRFADRLSDPRPAAAVRLLERLADGEVLDPRTAVAGLHEALAVAEAEQRDRRREYSDANARLERLREGLRVPNPLAPYRRFARQQLTAAAQARAEAAVLTVGLVLRLLPEPGPDLFDAYQATQRIARLWTDARLHDWFAERAAERLGQEDPSRPGRRPNVRFARAMAWVQEQEDEMEENTPHELLAAEREAPLRVIRDLFGNPFRPVVIAPLWRTANVVGLARAIDAERDWDRLPILADALLDAGCPDEQVLGHCRSLGPHARGCWLVDALVGERGA
jgi:hypothetical protein